MTNFIQRTSGAISEEECNTVIDFFENNKERHYKGKVGSDSRLDSKAKIDTEMGISLKELIEDSRLNPVARGLKNACDEYVENYPFLLKLREWSIEIVFKIQKYNPNEAYFAEHCENSGGIDGSIERRIAAVMVYLNTVTDGGQTHFPTQNISFSPKVGDILMWPAYWTHPHHGIPSPTQTKYIITGWYVFNDHQS
tara:strand:- start:83 stop:670 length:588 start_codon:yes stop_codon:yes gene_type:complete